MFVCVCVCGGGGVVSLPGELSGKDDDLSEGDESAEGTSDDAESLDGSNVEEGGLGREGGLSSLYFPSLSVMLVAQCMVVFIPAHPLTCTQVCMRPDSCVSCHVIRIRIVLVAMVIIMVMTHLQSSHVWLQ